MSYKSKTGVKVCNVTQRTKTLYLRKLGKFLRQKTTTIIIWVILLLAAINVGVQIVQSATHNLRQADIKTELVTGFEQLTPCIIEPMTDYDYCLRKLSVVSKALDIYKGSTPNEAIAWGAAQTYLFSLKSENYLDFYNHLKKWALLERYIVSDVSTPQEFREALINSYISHKST